MKPQPEQSSSSIIKPQWADNRLLPHIYDQLRRARQMLAQAGCDSPALDAELLAAYLLGIDRTRLWMEPERPLSRAQQEHFHQLVKRRCRREPLPHILGEWEFSGLTLQVSPDVLIPRPETETLVEVCLAKLKDMRHSRIRGTLNPELSTLNSQLSTLNGVEVGTGSGAVSIAIANHLPDLHIIATDSSEAALSIAQENCIHYNLADRITLLHGDLLEPLEAAVGRGHLPAPSLPTGFPPSVGRGCRPPPKEVDFIVANLPYIPTGEIPSLPPEVRDWEPRSAIDGGTDGLDAIRRLIAQAPRWLRPFGAAQGRRGGFIALEISPEQANEVQRLLSAQNFGACEIVSDLSGRPRVVIAEKQGTD
ncbi:MAG: peptide chain release factor N(5)-glutamine methyltransferase [Armatimonadetes bacterium]|nr:peptide chain release factor N(5)-glutamine methyltransferase [Armatimonadota bacterium]NIM24785.1 peptide chain release factor N(5)-glutamine methyltransferase [Armatimonadota bacterium]NIM68674.1 peptide chain release factor N(5)-glutamine methyltransferase [Armatimonadota bacterium]NIM76971.1 peptide chain release factor N(5)-glutamine methyltransferase [Armatimonadota bacterium]NIN06877.1 peptide chain release factor N(5)-glutamine methyltransferase [Armatimonadota bacterium]